ncbi:MAG TPA: magnesium transporter CorA family protein [Anaerolineae bacterium]
MTTTNIKTIQADGSLASFATLDAARSSMNAPSYLWLDYHEPRREDLMAVMAPLGLHPLSIEDCLDENQIPKIEDYATNSFMIFNALRYAQSELQVDEVNLFVGSNFVLSVSGRETDGLDPLRDIDAIVRQHIDTVRQGPAFLLHVIIDYLVDRKFDAVEAIGDELDITEGALVENVANAKPEQMLNMRRNLLSVRKTLFHEREILLRICRRDCQYIPEGAIYHFRDIYDHLARFFELTESYRDMVTSLTEMYLTLINNQMTRASNDTNLSVRRLTIITTIFMPLTLLAGIGGMSEWSMMTGPENWRFAYPAFLIAMVIIGIANYGLIRWIERKPPKL